MSRTWKTVLSSFFSPVLLSFFFPPTLVSVCRLILTNLFFPLQNVGWILLAVSPGKLRLLRINTAGGVGGDLQNLRLNKRRLIRNSTLEPERWIMSKLGMFLDSWGEPGGVDEKMLIICLFICIHLIPNHCALILSGRLAK